MAATSGLSPETAFAAVVQLAVDALRSVAGADHATIYLIEPDAESLVCVGTSRPDADRVVGSRRALTLDGPDRAALRSGRPLEVEPAQAAELRPPQTAEAGLTAALVLPMIRGGRPVGTAVIEVAGEDRRWPPAELVAIGEIARVAAEPLDNAARDTVFLGALGQLLEAFDALGRQAAGSDLAAMVAARARSMAGSEAAWVRYPNPDDGSLTVGLDMSLAATEADAVRDAANAFHGGERLKPDEPLYYADAMRAPDVPADLRRLALSTQLGSILIWPLVVRGQVTGDLAFLGRETEGFTPDQIAIAGALARFVAPLLLLPGRQATTGDDAPAGDAGAVLELSGEVVDGLPIPAVVEARDGSIAAANRAFGLTFNVSPATLVGGSFQALVIPAIIRMVEGEATAAQVLRSLRAGPGMRREQAVELRGPRGGPVTYRAHPLHAGASELIGRIHVFAPESRD